MTTDTKHEASRKAVRVAAIILAAGESSRMGRPKALLTYQGTTFLEHIVGVMREAGASPVKVILGHNHEAIERKVDLSGADVHLNSQYRQGQLSSLQTGIRALAGAGITGTLICLVDHPVINVALVRSLIEAFGRSGKDIVVPTFQGRRGHPILVSAQLFQEFLVAPLSEGARTVIRNHADDIALVPTDHPGILTDIDTPDDYGGLRSS